MKKYARVALRDKRKEIATSALRYRGIQNN